MLLVPNWDESFRIPLPIHMSLMRPMSVQGSKTDRQKKQRETDTINTI